VHLGDDAAVGGRLEALELPAVGEGVADRLAADLGAEATARIGEREDHRGPAGTARVVQAGDVAGAVPVVENVEQRAVEDGVVARPACQVHRVGNLESSIDALGLGIAARLLDGLRREIDAKHVIAERGEQDRVFTGAAADVEHVAPDQPGAFQLHHRGLRFTDHPRRGRRAVELIETRNGGCRIHD
jgi:hypothetical protein